MPCGCDDIPVDGRWRKASFGGDRTPCEIALEQRGDNLVGFARVYLPGRTAPVFVWHRVDLAALEDELEDAAEERAEARAEQTGIAEISGRKARRRRRRRRRKRRRARRKNRRKRIFGKLKKVAKKVGKNKVIRGIGKGVKKVVNNPLVKAAMSATPVGAAFVATTTAAKIAKKAIKGGKKAKNVIKKTHSAFTRGNPKARRAMKLFRHGAKQIRGSRVAAAMAGDGTWDEWEANEVLVGACIGGEVVFGAPDATDQEIEALVTFSGDDWAHARVGRGMGRRSRSRARAAALRVGDDRPRHGMGASRSRALARGGVTRY